MDDLLRRFYQERIRRWLDRELGPGRLEVSSEGTVFTVGDRYRLLFAPKACRWSLEVRSGEEWRPQVPSRDAISLTDWLGQVRRLVTKAP